MATEPQAATDSPGVTAINSGFLSVRKPKRAGSEATSATRARSKRSKARSQRHGWRRCVRKKYRTFWESIGFADGAKMIKKNYIKFDSHQNHQISHFANRTIRLYCLKSWDVLGCLGMSWGIRSQGRGFPLRVGLLARQLAGWAPGALLISCTCTENCRTIRACTRGFKCEDCFPLLNCIYLKALNSLRRHPM